MNIGDLVMMKTGRGRYRQSLGVVVASGDWIDAGDGSVTWVLWSNGDLKEMYTPALEAV